ncbi:hypothetical protein ACFLXP_04580 [Chloroflexota bacterium]
MFDRTFVEELLDWEFEGLEMEIPDDIQKDALIDVFYQNNEEDSYERFKDNIRSFLGNGGPNWDWIRDKIVGIEE